MSSSEQKTVAVFPEPGAWGPTNNLVAIANHLVRDGVRVVFVVEESFEGELERRGFEEALMRMTPPPAETEDVGEGWAKFVEATAPEFRKSTYQQLTTVTKPFWEELVGGAEYAHDRLMEIWEEIRPDVIVSDNVTGFAAVPLAGVPWVRMVSANPLEMRDPEIPPVFSGYSMSDRDQWAAFDEEFFRLHQPLLDQLSEFNQGKGADPLPAGSFQYDSPYLNLYIYPAELDYDRAEPLGPTWHRMDSSVREADADFDVSEKVGEEGKLIYLSLGSLGCMDVALMQRAIDALDKTDHRVIVSMGPLHERLRLGERMYGEQFLPQTAILPECDLVITHGGNNTLGEAFTFGLPLVALPLFWDQYDNGQRVQDRGFGRRLDTYGFDDDELTAAIDELTGDEAIARRLGAISDRLTSEPGSALGASLITRLLETGQPVT